LIYQKQKAMNTAKSVILTAIYFKGIEEVKKQAKQLAEDSLCTESYVRGIIRQVEKKQNHYS
jgi:hypothetical protein